jgi:tetratricopeptide (TPR) repeat protein
MKVFIKGYATVTRRVDGQLRTYDDIIYQMRKDIEPGEGWQPFNLDFEITPANVFSDFQHKVDYVRIRLWAYWPAGTCRFADLTFEEVGPVPRRNRRHAEAVTHVGLPPRLGDAAQQSMQPTTQRFDDQEAWHDAVNAFRGQDHEQALRLAEQLIQHAPHMGSYRLLAARALAQLERWDAAEQHARWLLEKTGDIQPPGKPPRQIESWQRDWAHVVQAQAYQHTGRVAEARRILRQLLQSDASPHAHAAAEKLLAEMDADRE